MVLKCIERKHQFSVRIERPVPAAAAAKREGKRKNPEKKLVIVPRGCRKASVSRSEVQIQARSRNKGKRSKVDDPKSVTHSPKL